MYRADFGYFFSHFSFLLKKRGKKKMRMNRKNCDFKSCLSAGSSRCTNVIFALYNYRFPRFKSSNSNSKMQNTVYPYFQEIH